MTPVLVASREASSNGSYIGLKATVKAQSTIYPASQTITRLCEETPAKSNALYKIIEFYKKYMTYKISIG